MSTEKEKSQVFDIFQSSLDFVFCCDGTQDVSLQKPVCFDISILTLNVSLEQVSSTMNLVWNGNKRTNRCLMDLGKQRCR